MASALNAVYVVAVVLLAVIGSLFIASTDTTEDSPRWLEISSAAIVVLFMVAMGVQFLA